MSNESVNVKEEPSWLPLPPMPRISVSAGARARLSHRRPIISSYPTSPSPFSAPKAPAELLGSNVFPSSDVLLPVISASSSSTSYVEKLGVTSTSLGSWPAPAAESAPVTKSVDLPDDSMEIGKLSGARTLGTAVQFTLPNSYKTFTDSNAARELLSPGPSPPPESVSTLDNPEVQLCIDKKEDGLPISLLEIAIDDTQIQNPGFASNNCCPRGDPDLSAAGCVPSSPDQLNVLENVENKRELDTNIEQESSSMVSEAEVIYPRTSSEVIEEGELEEGQLPGEWSGAEESLEVDHSVIVREGEHDEGRPAVGGWTPMSSERVDGSPPPSPQGMDYHDHPYHSSKTEEILSGQGSRAIKLGKAKKKKKKKHKKGEGSIKRHLEKCQEKYNEGLKKRKIERKEDGVSNAHQAVTVKATTEVGERTRNNRVSEQMQMQEHKPAADDLPEDGEILLESTKSEAKNGPLSSLVEAEVGLWTTDDVEDQLATQMEEEAAAKKKRGPETAERKLKRKIAKRKKRAEKEREMGIRRPPRTIQSKPAKVLCTHYMKGRCAKGENCTFSHDAVPLTKQEPCKFLMSNSCLKGDDCPYSHDLRAFPCKFFHTRGLCYDGANCQFSHGAISEEALEKLQKRVEKEKKDRLGSAVSMDVATPAFSTPLPPELDPDPLGWGTSSSYSTLQLTNPAHVRGSTDMYSDFGLDNHPTGPLLYLTSGSGQSTALTSSAISVEEKGLHGIVQHRKEVVAKCENGATCKGATALGAARMEDNSLASLSPPNERSNASTVFEVRLMEGTDAEPSEQKPSKDDTLADSRPPDPLCPVPNVLVAVAANSNPGRTVPLLRDRQLGSRRLDYEKVLQQHSRLSSAGRQNNVESLLLEALRY